MKIGYKYKPILKISLLVFFYFLITFIQTNGMKPELTTTSTTIETHSQQNCSYYEDLIKEYEWNISYLIKAIDQMNKTIINLTSLINEKDYLIRNLTHQLDYYKEKKYVEEIRNYLYYNITNYFQKTENIINQLNQILKIEVPICITITAISLALIFNFIYKRLNKREERVAKDIENKNEKQ